jgi:hypothetical protein
MRIQPAPSVALRRQLAEWRQPLDSDPDVDAAVTRMLSVIDSQLQRQQKSHERKP